MFNWLKGKLGILDVLGNLSNISQAVGFINKVLIEPQSQQQLQDVVKTELQQIVNDAVQNALNNAKKK